MYRSLPTYRADHDGPAGGGFEYYKVGCRYYDSQFGRFISRDSDLSQLPYAYCNDDPINFVDPSGRSTAKKVVSTIGKFLEVEGAFETHVGEGVVGVGIAFVGVCTLNGAVVTAGGTVGIAGLGVFAQGEANWALGKAVSAIGGSMK